MGLVYCTWLLGGSLRLDCEIACRMDGLLDDLLDDFFNKVSSSEGGSLACSMAGSIVDDVNWKGGGDGWKSWWLAMRLMDCIILFFLLTIFALYGLLISSNFCSSSFPFPLYIIDIIFVFCYAQH